MPHFDILYKYKQKETEETTEEDVATKEAEKGQYHNIKEEDQQ